MKKYILPSIGLKASTVILANGDFPKHPIALSALQNCEYLVCCDGAIENLSNAGIIPNAIVGDCDSLSAEDNERFSSIIHRMAEQETNDLTKAVNFCTSQGKRDIIILGATGKREDHTIGNISLLCEYMNIANVEMITDYGVFVVINQTTIFKSIPQQQVSLFAIDHKPMSSYGLLYPIENRVFTNWWQATLNEALEEEFKIETEGRVIVYRLFADR